MKKVIVGISVLLIAVSAILLTVNAQDKPQETKKACTEMTSKDCHSGPNGTACCGKMKYGSSADSTMADKGKCCQKGGDKASCKDGKDGHEGCCAAKANKISK
jgi:hypothetical protein